MPTPSCGARYPEAEPDDATREAEWIEGIRSGDEEAFEGCFRAHYRDLCRFLLPYVGSAAVAQEHAQEIFAGIWERREDWDPKGPIVRYLRRAARNRALNELRHRKVVAGWRTYAMSAFRRRPPDPEQLLVGEELSSAIRRQIAEMPERRREIFLMSRRAGLSHAEIADVLSISIRTVEVHIGRALSALRSVVEELDR